MRKGSADVRLSRARLALYQALLIGALFAFWYLMTEPVFISEASAKNTAFFFGRPLQVIKVVIERGQAMTEAAPAGTTSMSAVLGLGAEAVESAMVGIDDAWPANYNTPTQTVIGGTIAGLEKATEKLQAAGAKRVIPLNVSAAFHTPLVAAAAERLRAVLDRAEWRAPRVPVAANLTGRPHQGGDRIPQVMEMQLRSPVRWAACVASLVEVGCDTFVEVGPKRALTGMMRELAPGKTAAAVGSPRTVQELALAD